MQLTIVVADDHPLIRVGMVAQLAQLGTHRILEAWDQASLERAVTGRDDIALVLLDVVMPGADGEGWTVRFCERHPALPVLLVSGQFREELHARFARCANVRGLMAKSRGVADLRSAIDRALAGVVQWTDWCAAPPESGSKHEALTPRQRDVARLVCLGMTNREIAHALAMQEGTVKNHLKDAFARLGVTNRTELALRMPFAP